MFLVIAQQRSDKKTTIAWYPVAAYTTREAALQHCKEANSEEIRLHREVLGITPGPSAENKWDKVNKIPRGIRVLYEVMDLPTYENVLQYQLST